MTTLHRPYRGKRRPSRHGYVVIEIVATLGLVVLLFSAFYGAMRSVHRLERMAEEESRGLIVLRNVVQRVEAEPSSDHALIARLLADEFAKSPLASSGAYAAQVLEAAGRPHAVIRSPYRKIAEVRF